MNKKLTKLLTVTLVVVMMLALAVPVFAADPPESLNATGAVEIDKQLTVAAGVNTPELTFTFEVTSAKGSGAIENWTAMDGILEGVKIGNTSYTEKGESANIKEGKITTTLTFNASANATANPKQGFVIDFNGVEWTEPGYYRYTVKETAGGDSRVEYDTTTTYIIDVYVGYESDDATDLSILSVVVTKAGNSGNSAIYEVEEDEDEDGYGEVDEKLDSTPGGSSSTGWTADGESDAVIENVWPSYTLKVEKTVTGNQGDKNKEFTFKITGIQNCPDGKYTISYSGTGTSTTRPTEVTVSNGSISAVGSSPATELEITLKHGQSFSIAGLPRTAKCIITESNNDTYTVSYQINSYDAKDGSTCELTDGTGMFEDTTVVFTNNKEGIIPTGVLLTIAPFAALMLIGLVGITVVVLKKKHN